MDSGFQIGDLVAFHHSDSPKIREFLAIITKVSFYTAHYYRVCLINPHDKYHKMNEEGYASFDNLEKIS